MTDPRCWLCGVEPAETFRLTTWDGVFVRLVAYWSAEGCDHTHALTPPTPQQLIDAGHAAFRRFMEAH